MNDKEQIVGRVWLGSGHGFRAFIWRDGQAYNLNDCVDPQADRVLWSAEAVNNAGQIAGWGMQKGKLRAFVLTPVSNEAAH